MPKGINKIGVNKGYFQKKHKTWNWLGDKVKYRGLHKWVRDHINKSKICEDCGSIKNVDLANITGIYQRDFSNWKYLCRKCHMKSDGRLVQAINRVNIINQQYL